VGFLKSFVIGIAGGTGSGKSTFTNRLKAEFPEELTVVYYDNYYKAQNDKTLEERKRTNYDSPDSLDTELFLKQLKRLKSGKEIECPVYDFMVYNRTDKVTRIKPHPIILVEGILALSDARLRNLMDIKIYVEADADERILRRVTRDVKERGRDLDGIIDQYLTTVKPMHYIYVEPTKALADFVINGGKNEVAFMMVSNEIRHILVSSEL